MSMLFYTLFKFFSGGVSVASFADRLKESRKAKSLTQKKMAELLGITERGYQNYEIGKSTPNYETLLALANYFDVSLDYLTGRSDNPNRI